MPFPELKWPNDLEGQWPLLSVLHKRFPRCIFVANVVNPGQIPDEVSHGQAEFHRILSQNGQNYIEGQGEWPPILNNSRQCPKMPVCCKYVDSRSTLWRVIVRTSNSSQTGGWADGQRDRRRKRQYPFDLKGQGLKMSPGMPKFSDH